MWRYILRRSLLMIPIFLLISIVIFSLIHIVPGNPIDNLLGPGMTVEHQRKLTEKYYLDKPIHVQYFIWFKNMLNGDLGRSIIEKRPVSELLMHHLPYSLKLGLSAIVLSFIFGVSMGIISASARNTILDHIAMVFALLGVTIPSFWLGLILILYFRRHAGVVSGDRFRKLADTGPPGDYPRTGRCRPDCQGYPGEYAGSHIQGFRRPAPRQGSQQTCRPFEAYPPKLADSGNYHTGTAAGMGAGRCGDRGDRFCPTGARTAFNHGIVSPGLSGSAGSAPVVGDGHHAGDLSGRYPVCLCRSEGKRSASVTYVQEKRNHPKSGGHRQP